MGSPRSLGRALRPLGVFTTAVVLGLALPIGSASAQGMFDFFFGNRRSQPPQAHAYADPYGSPSGPTQSHPVPEGSRGATYCVRLCDGRYFPMQNHSGANPTQMCQAFCPAARTKIFSGSAISHAVGRDGSRYSDLENAFLYREKLIGDCTCNGKDPYGLARVEISSDPTLRAGDFVATDAGLAAYQGARRPGTHANALFTPLGDYTGVADAERKKLSEVKVMPAPPGITTVAVQAPPAPARTAERVAEPARPQRPRGFWDFFGFR